MMELHMHADHEPGPIDYSAHERALLAAFARTGGVDDTADARLEAALVGTLRADGFFGRRRSMSLPIRIAAAIVLFAGVGAIGAAVGARMERSRSLEGMLARTDLSHEDRLFVLQRAGSAYVRAANRYAAATQQNEATAVEVASQVLRGAAQAVARNGLDGGLTPRLDAALRDPSPVQPAMIWY
jgi:hypothetical protein